MYYIVNIEEEKLEHKKVGAMQDAGECKADTNTPTQNDFQYKKQGPSPISLVRATRIFSKAKTLKKKFDLSLDIGDNPIYPF